MVVSALLFAGLVVSLFAPWFFARNVADGIRRRFPAEQQRLPFSIDLNANGAEGARRVDGVAILDRRLVERGLLSLGRRSSLQPRMPVALETWHEIYFTVTESSTGAAWTWRSAGLGGSNPAIADRTALVLAEIAGRLRTPIAGSGFAVCAQRPHSVDRLKLSDGIWVVRASWYGPAAMLAAILMWSVGLSWAQGRSIFFRVNSGHRRVR